MEDEYGNTHGTVSVIALSNSSDAKTMVVLQVELLRIITSNKTKLLLVKPGPEVVFLITAAFALSPQSHFLVAAVDQILLRGAWGRMGARFSRG
jgi:hypothetical protein